MAYVKAVGAALVPAARRCGVPELLAGRRRARCAATRSTSPPRSAPFDLAYLDPPYNQHRYFTNYHVWETLVAWDAPEHYGVACKRVDARDDRRPRACSTASAAMPDALRARRSPRCDARVVVRVVQRRVVGRRSTSCATCARCTAHVEVLAFDSRRYVGAQIGIHNPQGERVGTRVARAQPGVRRHRRRAHRGPPARRSVAGGGGRCLSRPRCRAREGRRLRPLRGGAHHAVVPRGRRVLDRRVRDLLRADGRLALRTAPSRRPTHLAHMHARAGAEWPGRRSPSSTTSTTTCATSPTTTTPTPARRGASSGTASGGRSAPAPRSLRGATRLRVERALHPHALVERSSGTANAVPSLGTVTVNFADLPAADLLVDVQAVRRERVGGAAFVLERRCVTFSPGCTFTKVGLK